jgi:hypothetical protein
VSEEDDGAGGGYTVEFRSLVDIVKYKRRRDLMSRRWPWSHPEAVEISFKTKILLRLAAKLDQKKKKKQLNAYNWKISGSGKLSPCKPMLYLRILRCGTYP